MEIEAEPEVRAMEMTWADKIEARGREKGVLSGTRDVIVRLLESRFGEIPRRVRDQLSRIDDPERLQGLATRLLDAESLQDLGLDGPEPDQPS